MVGKCAIDWNKNNKLQGQNFFKFKRLSCDKWLNFINIKQGISSYYITPSYVNNTYNIFLH